MSTQNEVAVAIYSKLAASTALTSLLSGGTASPSIYQDLAPEGATPPYVVFNSQSPSTPKYTFTRVAFEDQVVTVKGVASGPSKAAGGTISAKIDLALNDTTLSISGHTNLLCRRLQDVDFVEVVAGVRFSHMGAMFRVWTA